MFFWLALLCAVSDFARGMVRDRGRSISDNLGSGKGALCFLVMGGLQSF